LIGQANVSGEDLYDLIKKLYPICRSITGNGVRQTLALLQDYIPLEVHEVASGTKVFDWEVPKEWNINDAYVKDSAGNKIIDFQSLNLHVVSYSVPINANLTLQELKTHLYSLPDHPEWVPYRTSYYSESWGFCISHKQLESLKDDVFEVIIDSSLKDGHLTYGEMLIPGEEEAEILISCHICHPSLCNDNLSGISVAIHLAESLRKMETRYSYRFLFIPVTIGSITWLALNKDKTHTIKHGFVLTNLGDAGSFTYKKSRRDTAEIDRAAQIILRDSGNAHRIKDFFPYGYDERQYCSPGFNLPVGALMRTPHGEYPEYHTSADNLEFVHPAFLEDSYRTVLDIITLLENNKVFKNVNPHCEPQLGKRGLYKHIGGSEAQVDQLTLLWVLNLSDGNHSLLDIAERSGKKFSQIAKAAEILSYHQLLVEVKE
jgi:aminopeptidase-like protein